MGFIHDDAVVLADARGRALFRGVHDGAHQPLYRGNVDFGGRFDLDIIHFFDVVDLVKGFELLQAGFLELVTGLLAQGGAVHHK